MKLIFIMSYTLNSAFMSMKQPMSLIIIILMQTTLTIAMMNKLTQSPWFSYLLMIIFIGGMMVLFVYITGISPNEKNKNNFTTAITMTMTITTIMTPFTKTELIFKMTKQLFMKIYHQPVNTYLYLTMMLNMQMYPLYIMMMMYLFITLIAVNKIINLNMGPLRKKH
uniref:NADH dehydrogenase subunit 6 n=1 Tax=Falconius longicornis TaxID=2793211 RepID=A0A7T0NC48_9ORTH|nr:NADH dehydrogenase subunit 6 [Falconius longicornis]